MSTPLSLTAASLTRGANRVKQEAEKNVVVSQHHPLRLVLTPLIYGVA
jgi:hypothetical protein